MKRQFDNMSHVPFQVSIIFFIINLVSANECPSFEHDLPYRTPSPINIDTKTAQVVNVSSPLVLGIGAIRFIILQNTGKSIIGVPDFNLPFSLSGGILCEDSYTYAYGRFYINPNGGRSGHTVDGVGFPLEATIYYVNNKYKNLKNAIKHRNGIVVIVQTVTIRPIPNLLFIPLQLVLNLGLLEKPGSVFPILSPFEAGWFDDVSFINEYYVYPGSYPDPFTGKEYDCAIYIVLAPGVVSLPQVQFQAFKNALGSNGKPIQTITPPPAPVGKRQVLKVIGDVQQAIKIGPFGIQF